MLFQKSKRLRKTDLRLTRWMADYGIIFLRISIGIIYVWFGILKFFPNLSPAEGLAVRTIEVISFGLIEANISMPILATLEVLIGVGLISGFQLRVILLLLLFQMAGAISPVFFFPEVVFINFPYALTLEGQYIVKNLVIISAAIVIGSTVRGGKVIADPSVAYAAKRKENQNLRKV